MAAENRCVWLYAVTDDAALLASELNVAGLGEGVVRPLRAAGLAAIVGDVDERDFGQAALHRNLEDRDWLEQTARVHHAVINAVGAHQPVVPMRLATIYGCDASVAETLQDRAADFRAALSRVMGRSEWGVKAFAAAPGAAPTDPADGQPDSAAGPGAAYLRRRRAQLTAHKTAHQEATVSAHAIFAGLRRLAVAARLYPPQSPELTGHRAAMVLNAAYLVADEQAETFAAAVADLTTRHTSVWLGLTGPWPAYSFVAEREGEESQG